VALMLTYIVQPVWVRRAPSARTAEGTRLRETVARLDGFAPRDHDHVENLDAAAKFLSEQMRSAGATVEVQEYRVGARTYRNVIGSFGPDQGERLVVGAHYDVFGGFSGADDNTSGVAALLALAESLGKKAPAKRVDLVAYTLEEPPYFRTKQMGSWVHANSLRDQGVKLVAMISIEMVGYFSDKPGSQNYPAPGMGSLYGDRADFIAVVGNVEDPGTVRKVKAAMAAAADLPVNSINAPRSIEGIDFSDHSNYWDAGYRAVMVTDTSFFRNPHYHTADDRPATLDYDRMAVVVQQLEAAVRALAR
ncbi:MAG TPA: M28 family peptidase, partial [Terriglobales bacterium]|nr:M28 family peptidase [Terriglobales bacterium]